MKAKLQLEVLRALAESAAMETSLLVSSQKEDTSVVFGIHLKEANKLKLEGKEEKPYLTFTADCITRVEGKQPTWKKLYHRDYPVVGKSHVELSLQAYHEFLTIGLATFLLSAKETTVEVLEQVSQPS